eukprot:8231538-Pyramimonas_sp.AAC.1
MRGEVKTPEGPQHRPQTANQGVQYIKGVHGLPSDHRLQTTAMFKIPRSSAPCVSSGIWYPGLIRIGTARRVNRPVIGRNPRAGARIVRVARIVRGA